MHYRTLGGTGIEVSAFCLGTMMFGAIGNPDHDDCVRIAHAALDAGINFVDTADMYSGGEAETIVGKALLGRRDEVVLATKVHFAMGEGRNRSGNSRRWLMQAVHESLARLQTDYLDLYLVHRPDPATDIEETLAALTDLQRAGTIRAFGCSTFPAEDIVDAHHVALARGLGRFRCEQSPYSLLDRRIEGSVLPTCERLGMGVMTWSPLGWGFLTGRLGSGRAIATDAGRAKIAPGRFDLADPGVVAKLDVVDRLAALAAELGTSLPALAHAFAAAHPAVSSVIVGPRTAEQLADTLAGQALVLDDAALDAIDAIVPPGTDVHAPYPIWARPVLERPERRRRRPGERAAG